VSWYFVVAANPNAHGIDCEPARRHTKSRSFICVISAGKHWRPMRVMLDQKVLA
jgi:hypothetical protein